MPSELYGKIWRLLYRQVYSVSRMSPNSNGTILFLGGSGFIGQRFLKTSILPKWKVRTVSSLELDLTRHDACERLIPMLRDIEVCVFAAAITPDRCRTWQVFARNIRMGTEIAQDLNPKLKLMVYISSDAVFAPNIPVISESTLPCPDSLYGTMHLAREQMLQEACREQEIPLLILRPCAIYGAGDTHNSYGPNRFIRSAIHEGRIELFGEGEDVRPHLFVDDFVSLLMRSIESETTGVLHVIPEESYSFIDVAEIVRRKMGRQVKILFCPRASAASKKFFDAGRIGNVFPDFTFTGLEEGIERQVHAEIAT